MQVQKLMGCRNQTTYEMLGKKEKQNSQASQHQPLETKLLPLKFEIMRMVRDP